MGSVPGAAKSRRCAATRHFFRTDPSRRYRAGPASLAQLRSLREAKGLAIETLARTVGISPSYLGLIESGERQPDAAIRRSLAWELGIAGWRDEV